MFASIIGHENVLSVLKQAGAHPAPAYLFHGPRGVGKRSVAERFASALLGMDPVRAIHELPLQAHPDFFVLAREPDSRDITVKQVRDMLARLHLTPAAGSRVVVLVDQADRLNNEAANALLKDVEDPPPYAHFLFCTRSPEALPATLRSRLVSVRFDPVPRPSIKTWLIEQGFDAALADIASAVSHGSPGIALSRLKAPEAFQARVAEARELVRSLTTASLAFQLQDIDIATKQCEAGEDTEGEWRLLLTALMNEMGGAFRDQPIAAARAGLALCFAWNLAGSGSSPRLALEWGALSPYLKGDERLFSFLIPYTLRP